MCDDYGLGQLEGVEAQWRDPLTLQRKCGVGSIAGRAPPHLMSGHERLWTRPSLADLCGKLLYKKDTVFQ